MARSTLNLKVTLDNVHCHDEGDGPGNAEPYLWPVYFKIDGDSYAVAPGSGFIGFPITETREGHHGNLANTDVDEGDDVTVPDPLGTWQNTLRPIPIYDPTIKSLIGDDLPGIAGVAVVLMEEDGWPDDLANIGYNAFFNAVQLAVARVAAGFQRATHAPTKEEINAAIRTVKDSASGMVHDAVKGTMSGPQLAWFGTFGNNDDTIGSEVWIFDHDDFARQAVIGFSRRWSGDESGDGDWELSGTAVGVVPCPADALVGFLSNNGLTDSDEGEQRREFGPALAAMRDFRRKDYETIAELEPWLSVLQARTPDIVRIVARERAVRDALHRLVAGLPDVLAAPDQPLPIEHLRDVAEVLEGVSKISPQLHRAFAARALQILPELQGESWNGALKRVARTRPLGRQRPRSDAS